MKNLFSIFAVAILVIAVVTSCNKKEEVKETVIENPVLKVEKKAPVKVIPLRNQIAFEATGDEWVYFVDLKPFANKYEGFLLSAENSWFEIANIEAIKYQQGDIPVEKRDSLRYKLAKGEKITRFKDNSLMWTDKDGNEKQTREEGHKKRNEKFDRNQLLK